MSVVLCPLSSADEAQLGQGAGTASFHRLARSLSITNPTLARLVVLCPESLSVNKLPSTRITERLNQPAAGWSPLVPALGLSHRVQSQLSRPRGPQGTPGAHWLGGWLPFSLLLQRSYLYLSMTVRAAETPSPGPKPRLALWPSDCWLP